MLSIRYYRQYLWIFFYMFFLLMIVALAWDTFGGTTNENGNGKIQLSRFINVLVCFSFAGLGTIMQYYCSRGVMGLRHLGDRKKWIKKRMKIRRRRMKRVVKRRHLIKFFLLNLMSYILVLLPLILICILSLVGVWSDVESKVFQKEFFCIAILIRYASWYLTLFVSRFSIFFNRQRLNKLI